MVDRLASRTPTLDAVLHALIDPERTDFEIRHLDLGRARSVWLAELRREIAGLSARAADGDSWQTLATDDHVCKHGTAMDVHCCNCHSGFIFDRYHVCEDHDGADDDDGSYLWSRCYACGHRLRFASDGCPQCGIHFKDGDDPPNWPELCDCERCQNARAEEPK